MMEVEKYIEKGNNYIVIFTNFDNIQELGVHKSNLCLESNGYTCCWVIAKSREIEKIILYVRENGENRIYKADYTYRENIEGRRYKIYYKNLEFIESSIANWQDFANTQNPIRYINK